MEGDERLLANVIDLLPVGVWIARAPGGEFVFANQTFREIMGMDARGDVVAGGYAEPYRIYDRDGRLYPEHRMPFVRALEARAVTVVDDIVIHRHDGRRVHIHATARPIFDGDTITHVVIAFIDATAELSAEAARRDTEQRLRHAQRLESLGTMAAGVAHDFNNLLGSISLIASMLRLREGDPARASDLRRIEATTESAARLTQSLLAFGRHGPAKTVRFDVGEVAGTLIELIRRTFDRNIEIVFGRDGALPVIGDPAAIEQLLMNLAVNARDAMPEGGRLDIRVARAGDRVTIEVRDTGPGVPPELRSRIFEPYFSTKGDRDQPGRGLGLATAYGVVESHHGTIDVCDAEPHGAVFRIALPMAAAPAPAVSPPAAGGHLDDVRMGHGTVLIVDDEPLVRATLRRALNDLGYEVVEVGDGVAALEYVASGGHVDVVLLDSVMPRKGGRDTLVALRSRAEPPPVIVMGGRIVQRERDEFIARGALAILDKPFDVPVLSRILADAVPKR
jgi:two-component system, cell cycle sensor histidine kinase and response regulator CckA